MSSSATSTVSATATSTATASAATYTPTTVSLNWNIGYVNVDPDGTNPRSAIGVNGKWPLTPVTAYKGDTLELTITNSISEGTSVHFHGLFQNGTVEFDGPSGVTQCPTPPGETFVYKFPLQQTGTYWIHGHNLGHYVDGLRTPLIIKDPTDKNGYEDVVVSLSDWYYHDHATLLGQFLDVSNPAGNEPVPDAVLVNESQDSTVTFVPGKTYRLRVVSMSAIGMYTFWIDGHNMTIIEVDGIDVEPYDVSAVNIAPAQRYSILVKALTSANDTAYNYQFHSWMDPDMFDQPPTYNTITNMTIVYKEGNPLFPATDMPDDVFDDTAIMSIVPTTAIAAYKADKSFDLQVIFQVMTDGTNHGTFNSIAYTRPKVPTLLTVLSVSDDLKTNPLVYGPSTHSYVLNHMEATEIIIENTDAGNHPFHLHGHAFQVIEVNGERGYDPTNVTEAKFPPRRDTVMIPGGGYAIIRFVNDNPGVWLFHCHIEWHLQAGLAAIFIEAPTLITVAGGKKNVSALDTRFTSQCTSQGLSATGNAAGNAGLDLSGYNYGPQVLVTGTTRAFWGSIAGCAVAAVIGVASVIFYSS
ncbi:multicopper oxidase-domain-containing protein [Zopfochytrium polystomum]|nr:multicopper oxidase-domain-containing protein [Zopfochytrium polystomum]